VLTRYRYEAMLSVFSSENIYVQSVAMRIARFSATPDYVKFRTNFHAALAPLVPTINATHPIDDSLGIRAYESIVLPARNGRGWFKMLVFAPPNRTQRPLPTILHIHGGWWVASIPDAVTRDFYGRRIVAQALKEGLEVNVAELDYRLAPEHPFPAALHDVQDALAYLREHADTLNIDVSKMIVGGESAGGNLALSAVIADVNAKRRIAAVAAVMSVCDIGPGWNESASYNEWVYMGFTHELNNAAAAAYCPAELCDREDSLVSPLRTAKSVLKLFPPTVIKTHGRDPLADGGVALAAKLQEAGARVKALHCANCVHLTVEPDELRLEPYTLAVKMISATAQS